MEIASMHSEIVQKNMFEGPRRPTIHTIISVKIGF